MNPNLNSNLNANLNQNLNPLNQNLIPGSNLDPIGTTTDFIKQGVQRSDNYDLSGNLGTNMRSDVIPGTTTIPQSGYTGTNYTSNLPVTSSVQGVGDAIPGSTTFASTGTNIIPGSTTYQASNITSDVLPGTTTIPQSTLGTTTIPQSNLGTTNIIPGTTTIPQSTLGTTTIPGQTVIPGTALHHEHGYGDEHKKEGFLKGTMHKVGEFFGAGGSKHDHHHDK